MTVSLLSSEAPFLLLLFFSITNFTAQSLPGPNFSCPVDSPTSCVSYITYLARPPDKLNLGNISDLLDVSRQSIASVSNLVSEDTPLFPDQLLLVPIRCGCTRNQSFANITYQIKEGDNFYLVQITTFENITKWEMMEDLNPNFTPTLLYPGDKVIVPLLCKCPSKSQLQNGIQHLITYVWQPEDDLLKVSTKFNAYPDDIVAENNISTFSSMVDHPILIPVSQLPILTQQHPPPTERRGSHHHGFITSAISTAVSLLMFFFVAFLVQNRCYKNKKILVCSGSSCQDTAVLIQTKDHKKSEYYEPKIIQDKLLPGVSGYIGKQITYDVKVIMEATMHLHEHYRIGGSVYRANINGKVLAIKKTKEDVSEELKILGKVNHSNLIKLLGTSSDTEGNCFLVYEYAENGSLDRWLRPKSATSSSSIVLLTWTQRLQVALDVANGLQYMHEHTQPTIVHRDIRTSNILLDSRFKSKIANFSVAIPAKNAMIPKIDVFAFGVVLLELLSGKRAMVTKENGEVLLLWKEIIMVLEVAEKREERLKKWMDPKLEGFYPIDGALSMAILARACTLGDSSARPSMAEIVFNLTVLSQSSSHTLQRSWSCGLEVDEVAQIISPVKAR
ncbi:hypothetical protein K2173_005980 [Erythroxylum novogranatense]|uniref:Protein kinase domain-containing protein n=1 Tax=Erythroxylum novogranatense TaxID=1862640 RepID=A0AAV8TDD5_9ROSI|nr:hypothetical protein K2173_005980 [Erythroxylum novogranatense]